MRNWPAATRRERRPDASALPGYCIKNHDDGQDQGEAEHRLAAGRRRLAVAEQVPEPDAPG